MRDYYKKPAAVQVPQLIRLFKLLASQATSNYKMWAINAYFNRVLGKDEEYLDCLMKQVSEQEAMRCVHSLTHALIHSRTRISLLSVSRSASTTSLGAGGQWCLSHS